MKISVVLIIILFTLLTGCSVSLERKDLAQYENIGIIYLLKNSIMFTEQGPLPIQIKQKSEEVSDWEIVENLQKSSHALLSGHFQLVSLEYDSESLSNIFDERETWSNWPELTKNQIQVLKEIIRDNSIDSIVVIKEGTIPLGEIKGVIEGMGIYQRKIFFLKPRVQIHSILSGRVFETVDFKAIAYHGMAISDFRDFNNYPWSFGFSEMSEQSKQEAKTLMKKSSTEALLKLLKKLGLIEG